MTIPKLAVEYALFNAERTLRTAGPSTMQAVSLGTATLLTGEFMVGYHPDVSPPRIDIPVDEMTTEIEAALTKRGYRKEFGLNYLVGSPKAPAPRHDIRRWTDGGQFLDLLDPDLAPEIKAAKRKYYCTEKFRVFVAHVHGRPVGWATLYVADDGRHGYLANAFVQPEFRRRGIQTDLLHARMRDAGDLGLESLLTDVVASKTSERNCRRAGFRLAAQYTVWLRPPDPTAAASGS